MAVKVSFLPGMTEQEYQQQTDMHQIYVQLQTLRIQRPPYFAFIEEEYMNRMEELEAMKNDKVSLRLLLTMRGIMDSRYSD